MKEQRILTSFACISNLYNSRLMFSFLLPQIHRCTYYFFLAKNPQRLNVLRSIPAPWLTRQRFLAAFSFQWAEHLSNSHILSMCIWHQGKTAAYLCTSAFHAPTSTLILYLNWRGARENMKKTAKCWRAWCELTRYDRACLLHHPLKEQRSWLYTQWQLVHWVISTRTKLAQISMYEIQPFVK